MKNNLHLLLFIFNENVAAEDGTALRPIKSLGVAEMHSGQCRKPQIEIEVHNIQITGKDVLSTTD